MKVEENDRKRQHSHTHTLLPMKKTRELMVATGGADNIKREISLECQKFDHVYSLRNGS
jgi:hypothetical protein